MVFNYSEMVNLGFRMDCHTFWNILGTSKDFTKSGPLHPLFITEILSQIPENHKSFLKIIIFTYQQIMDFQNVGFFRKDGHRK